MALPTVSEGPAGQCPPCCLAAEGPRQLALARPTSPAVHVEGGDAQDEGGCSRRGCWKSAEGRSIVSWCARRGWRSGGVVRAMRMRREARTLWRSLEGRSGCRGVCRREQSRAAEARVGDEGRRARRRVGGHRLARSPPRQIVLLAPADLSLPSCWFRRCPAAEHAPPTCRAETLSCREELSSEWTCARGRETGPRELAASDAELDVTSSRTLQLPIERRDEGRGKPQREKEASGSRSERLRQCAFARSCALPPRSLGAACAARHQDKSLWSKAGLQRERGRSTA